MRSMMVLSAVLVMLLLSVEPACSAGIHVPCNSCEGQQFESPAAGWWYDPTQPGTGLNIEVQGQMLLGSYYSFTEEGDSRWFIFHGVPTWNAEDGHLVLSAPLQELEGGQCPGCAYTQPQLLGERSIELRFDQRNHGTFSIDGGEPHGILPLIVGVGVSNPFPDLTDYVFPDLQGEWVLVLENEVIDGPWATSSLVVQVTDQTLSRNDDGVVVGASHLLFEEVTMTETLLRGSVKCKSEFNADGTRLPLDCAMTISAHFPGDSGGSTVVFPMPMANIGYAQFSARNPQARLRVTGLRYAY